MFRKITLGLFALCPLVLAAQENTLPTTAIPTPTRIEKPLMIPSPPAVRAKAYILIDVNSGKILSEKDSTLRLPPASLTKMMTLYVVSNALHHQQIKLSDNVRISETAWHAEGSRMFIKEGDEVSVENLIKGIIVDSGNDACVAIAEHVGGSEPGFSQIMNQQAAQLGMASSHFTDSTGLPNPDHYTTAKDLAILGRALINNFPVYYPWYQQKWFTYNNIRQPNRNRLLWRNSQIDGIKTGHTNEAGYCLVSSAKRGETRLLAVVLGAPSDAIRADDSERLINYGFRFFETHALYRAAQPLYKLPIYKGRVSQVIIGPKEAIYITLPSGQFSQMTLSTQLHTPLKAPLDTNTSVGDLVISLHDKPMARYPLYALQPVELGGLLGRLTDGVRLTLKKWLG